MSALGKLQMSDKATMRLSKSIFILIAFAALLSPSAWAFNHLDCESSLHGWTVSSGGTASILLNEQRTSATFDEDESSLLLVRDGKGKEIASVSPWNGVLLQKGKFATKKKYKFNFETDKKTQFTLVIKAPKSKTKHRLSCQFTP